MNGGKSPLTGLGSGLSGVFRGFLIGHTGLLSFIIDAPVEKVPFFIDQLKIFKIGCSWGGFESLVMAPLYRSSQEELDLRGVPDGKCLIRIHCGLEGADVLIQDLRQALAAI